jgi:hypothetical protein
MLVQRVSPCRCFAYIAASHHRSPPSRQAERVKRLPEVSFCPGPGLGPAGCGLARSAGAAQIGSSGLRRLFVLLSVGVEREDEQPAGGEKRSIIEKTQSH